MLDFLADLPDAPEDLVEDYGREDPRDFIRDVLGEEPTQEALDAGLTDPWTPQQELVLRSVVENKYTAVPSCNGAGKSWLVARLVLWFLFRRPRSVVVFTAPTARQVETVLWNEIRSAISGSKTKLPCRILHSPHPQLIVGNKWFAIGVATKASGLDLTATTFQGFHSDYVMIAYDEATGIAPEIKDAGDSIILRPTDRAIATANPTDPTSWFKDACQTWSTVHFDGLEHPNVIHDNPLIVPGAITKDWIQERLDEYGSERAPLYLARCRGIFPDQSTDALIQASWLMRAQRVKGEDEQVEENEDGYGIVLGVDVAGEGEDLFVIWAIQNSRLFVPRLKGGKHAWHSGRDVMKGVGLIRAVLAEIPDVRTIAIDDTALGGGVTARLHELNSAGRLPMYRAGTIMRPEGRKPRIVGVNFGETAWTRDMFHRKKDELWWDFREALRKDQVLLPTDGELAEYAMPRHSNLIRQLQLAIYDRPRGDKIMIYDKRGAGGQSREAKEKTQTLPEKSPDNAHGAILAWFARTQTTRLDRAPRLVTTQQIFDEQSREMIARAIGKRRQAGSGRPGPNSPTPFTSRQKKGPQPSWTRRRR